MLFLPVSDTIAFHSALTSYSTIESAVIFNEVILNEGEGYVCFITVCRKQLNLFNSVNNCELFVSSYDSLTGVFMVPPGGDGVYYFFTYLLGSTGEFGIFDMTLNNDRICSTYVEHNHSGSSDLAPGSCSAVVQVVAGKEFSILV